MDHDVGYDGGSTFWLNVLVPVQSLSTTGTLCIVSP